ncbi:MAG: peptidylprolyl isomerase [Oceanospirillaceae bacterium]|nr:peptidylprolyl isomerase [Oceanospirillaceae bacterium]
MNKIKMLVASAAMFSALSSFAVADVSGVAVANIDSFISAQKVDKSKANWKGSLTIPPMQQFSEGKSYFWNLQTTGGDIEIELLSSVAPMHVTSTIYLTRLGFYDNIVFHRVITNFMAQGGDPTGTGRGGPGYHYKGEFSPAAKHNKPGMLSMANAGPGTDGSQFFLTFKATPHLDGRHTVFGRVSQGMDSVKALEKFGSRSGSTSKELKIIKATIEVR